jgi:HSP20 family protein
MERRLRPKDCYLFFHLKSNNMYYNQSCAAKGKEYGSRQRPMLIRSMQRAAVNIYKGDNSYEMLVFAPGRIKEHFRVDVAGTELKVSYTPPEGFPRPDWVLREYSRGGFTRVFTLDETYRCHPHHCPLRGRCVVCKPTTRGRKGGYQKTSGDQLRC